MSTSNQRIQMQDSDESCEECNNLANNLSQDQSSSSDNSQKSISVKLVLHKQKHHSIQSTMKSLQEQISLLKVQNKQKDYLIHQLQKKLKSKKSVVREDKYSQLDQKTDQIIQLKEELFLQKRRSSKLDELDYYLPQQSSKRLTSKHNQKNRRKSKRSHSIKQFQLLRREQQQDSVTSIDESSPQFRFNKAINSKTLKDKIRKYEQRIEQLEKQTYFYVKEQSWMNNFMASFIKMTETMSSYFNERVINRNWSLKKKSKTSWRYIKHIISYLIPPEELK